MKYADHHGLPIVTFVDTPGAFADLKSEELGQVCMYSTFYIVILPFLFHLVQMFSWTTFLLYLIVG